MGKGYTMDDFTVEELTQLVNYYKQRSGDLEFQVLQLQIKMNKVSQAAAKSTSVKKDKE